jgi:hypothetical protein
MDQPRKTSHGYSDRVTPPVHGSKDHLHRSSGQRHQSGAAPRSVSQSATRGTWSDRRPTLVNDAYEPPSQSNLLKPPIRMHTYSSAEEGRLDPQAKTNVFSSMWNLGRSTPSDIPTNVSYPSDANEHDLFAPSNVVDRKGRGSYISRTNVDDKEHLRRRPGLTARAGSEVGKALTKVSSVITAQERRVKRDPVIVHNVRSE